MVLCAWSGSRCGYTGDNGDSPEEKELLRRAEEVIARWVASACRPFYSCPSPAACFFALDFDLPRRGVASSSGLPNISRKCCLVFVVTAMRCIIAFKAYPLIVRRSCAAAWRIISASSAVHRIKSAVRLVCGFPAPIKTKFYIRRGLIASCDSK